MQRPGFGEAPEGAPVACGLGGIALLGCVALTCRLLESTRAVRGLRKGFSLSRPPPQSRSAPKAKTEAAISSQTTASPTPSTKVPGNGRVTDTGPPAASRLGLTIDGLRAQLDRPPANGDGLTVCERLQRSGSGHVGAATIFVSHEPRLPLPELVEALDAYLERRPTLPRDTTCFWIRATSAPHGEAAQAWVPAAAAAIGRTVLVLEGWPEEGVPAAFGCASCVRELYHTQRCGGSLALAMSRARRAAFDEALLCDFGTMLERGTSALILQLARLRQSAGATRAARALLEDAHAARTAAFGWRHADTRLAFDSLAALLREEGDTAASRALHEARLAACREQLGERHEETLAAVSALGSLLKEAGNLGAALPLLDEALVGLRAVAGPTAYETLQAAHRLGMLHYYARRLPRAKGLLMEAIRGLGETRGPRHPDTLEAVANLGTLLHREGHAAGALPLLQEVLDGRRAHLGDLHPETLDAMAPLAALLRTMGEERRARALLEEGLAGLKTLRAPREQELRWVHELLGLLEAVGDEPAVSVLREQYALAPPAPPPCIARCECPKCRAKRGSPSPWRGRVLSALGGGALAVPGVACAALVALLSALK